MKALSIRQPWAWLIVNGYKDIENRTWPTRFRGRVCVHAPKLLDPGWFPVLVAEVRSREIDVPANLALGALVGEVDIVVPAVVLALHRLIVDVGVDVENSGRPSSIHVGPRGFSARRSPAD